MTAREREMLAVAFLESNKGKDGKPKPPNQLRHSGMRERSRAKGLIGDGGGLFCRLQMLEPDLPLQHYVIAVADLGLPLLEPESNLWSHEAVSTIKEAIRDVAPSAFYARLEAGHDARKIHVHLVAHSPPLCPNRKVKERDLVRLAQYLCKPPAAPDVLSIGHYLEGRKIAKQQGKVRLPRLSFWQGIGRG